MYGQYWNKIKIYDKITNLTTFIGLDELGNCFLYIGLEVFSFYSDFHFVMNEKVNQCEMMYYSPSMIDYKRIFL